jgi:hypothetical protein
VVLKGDDFIGDRVNNIHLTSAEKHAGRHKKQ